MNVDVGEIGGAPASRVRRANLDRPAPERGFVLYWMIAARRTHWNFALDRAIAWARALDKPVLILEALRSGYPWASARLHRFVLEGMRDNMARLEKTCLGYYPYVEPQQGAGKGLLAALAQRACVVVTDEFPCFFLPRMVEAAARKIGVCLEAVDGNGLLPLAATDKDFSAAIHFRRYLQRELPRHLAAFPSKNPLAGFGSGASYRVPREISARWPRANVRLLAGDPALLAALPIDPGVPVAPTRGGSRAGQAALRRFIQRGLASYARLRDEPSTNGTSRLSPYLHFGHLSAHEVFQAVMRNEDWSPAKLPARATGARSGWWRVGSGAEAFLDQLVVWRELAYNTCAKRASDYDRYESLPMWARATLEQHLGDPRPHLYGRPELEGAKTHDELWNAAQRQLLREGWYHNTLRMLWGKKILEWSASPREALATMIQIMNRWSLDGRDPNSYAGFLWVLGRYDRPWPERNVYGKVRSMSSLRTAAKIDAARYLEAFADGSAPQSKRSSLR